MRAEHVTLLCFVSAFTVTTDNALTAAACQASSSAASVPQHHHYNHDEVDRFMAAVQTIKNFAISSTCSGFGISANQKYVDELWGIYLQHGTAAVEQLTGNIRQCSVREPGRELDSFCADVIEETKPILVSIVEHAATLRDCGEQRAGNTLQVSHTAVYLI